MLIKIINILNLLFSKKERIVIQVFPNFEDNGVAIAEYLERHYKLPIFFINQDNKYDKFIVENSGINVLYAKTLKSIYYLLTSKYLLFTHGSVLYKFSKRQVVFNLWHGFPYKAIGLLNEGKGIYSDLTATTSDYGVQLFSDIFGVPINTVKVTGFPRNDRLFGFNKEDVFAKLDLDHSKTTFFWLPTYRKSIIGEIRADGVDVGNPFGVENFDIQVFNDYLSSKNSVCLVKPHPMAPKYNNENIYENVKFLNDDFLHSRGITLYQLLGVSDCLISDFSSVIIDYILTDKPIVCFVEDLKEYQETRGLLFEDFENYVPGAIVNNIEEFYEILNKFFINGDLVPEKRNELKGFFHENFDNNSAKRVVEFLFEENKN